MDGIKKLIESYKGLSILDEHSKNVEISESFLKILNEQDEEDKSGQVQVFQKALAWARALSFFYHTAHWQSKGGNYYGDHLLFGRLYEEANGEIDGIAEKAVGISGEMAVELKPNLELISKVIQQIPTLSEMENNTNFFNIALKLETKVTSFYAKQVTSGMFSQGTINFFAGLADKHENNLYLIKQRIK